MPLPPLQFEPILKPRAWGGNGLHTLGKQVDPKASPPIGESWELSDLGPPVPDGVSRVRGGPFTGTTLDDLMRHHRKALLGRAEPSREGRFPLLVKYLDARENLSVQVHPTPAFAKCNPSAHVKTEAWIVLHAQPGAVVYRGVHPGVSAAEFERAIRAGAVTDVLVRKPVRRGDCLPLRSGVCHALGAGVVAAEIETPSDTTFRLFDWNRNDPERPLHIEKAMQCLLLGHSQQLDHPPVTNLADSPALWSSGLRADSLCGTEHFEVEAIEASPAGDAAPFAMVTNEVPVVGMLLHGEALMETERHQRAYLRAGDTVLFPAQLVPTMISLSPEALFLRAMLPSPGVGTLDTRPLKERLA
ncbi:MAG: class I mannose-6-phosphate isomerase [Phycisphaerae bacterium]|nr:class I mannose-6-phosphate isomerase [Phycisphaerae bacterium]